MRSVVIFDSEFGNTREIAETIAAELQMSSDVKVEKVGTPETEAMFPASVDLVFVGGPTQMHGVSPAMRNYLGSLIPGELAGVRAAVFDTRVSGRPLFTGAASGGIATLLEKSGAILVVPPESFIVNGKEGPLAEGELDHARSWARQVVSAALPQPTAFMFG